MKTRFKLNRIGLKTLDRSGSNLVLALFHYHPEFFSLTEKFKFDTTDFDSLPESKFLRVENRPYVRCRYPEQYGQHGPIGPRPEVYAPEIPTCDEKLVEWLQLQDYSVFSGADKYIKDISNVKNLVIKMPKDYIWDDETHRKNYKKAIGPYCNLKYSDHEYDKKIYLIRNPFRVAMSIRPPEVEPRPHDMHVLKKLIKQTLISISEYKKDLENGFESKLIFFEYFLKNYIRDTPKLIKWADPAANSLSPVNLGHDFFKNTPSRLLIPDRPEPPTDLHILGTGGFDPLKPINYERTMNRGIYDSFAHGCYRDDELLNYARHELGLLMFDYWFNDVEHQYEEQLNLA